MANSSGGTLQLGDLPAMVSCRLHWAPWARDVLHVSPSTFSTATGITQLHLNHCKLQLAPCCFSGLSRLEELDLSDCGAAAIPAALSEVGSTLRKLDLSSNDGLQIDPAGRDILLALPLLQSIDLRATPDGKTWTAVSTRSLVSLCTQWQLLHPAAGPLDLKV